MICGTNDLFIDWIQDTHSSLNMKFQNFFSTFQVLFQYFSSTFPVLSQYRVKQFAIHYATLFCAERYLHHPHANSMDNDTMPQPHYCDIPQFLSCIIWEPRGIHSIFYIIYPLWAPIQFLHTIHITQCLFKFHFICKHFIQFYFTFLWNRHLISFSKSASCISEHRSTKLFQFLDVDKDIWAVSSGSVGRRIRSESRWRPSSNCMSEHKKFKFNAKIKNIPWIWINPYVQSYHPIIPFKLYLIKFNNIKCRYILTLKSIKEIMQLAILTIWKSWISTHNLIKINSIAAQCTIILLISRY